MFNEFAFRLIQFASSFGREQILAKVCHVSFCEVSEVSSSNCWEDSSTSNTDKWAGCPIWPLSTTTFPFLDIRMIEYHLLRKNCENCTHFITINNFNPTIFGLGLVAGIGYGKGKYPPPPILSSLRVICQAKCITLITFAYFTVCNETPSLAIIIKPLTKSFLPYMIFQIFRTI